MTKAPGMTSGWGGEGCPLRMAINSKRQAAASGFGATRRLSFLSAPECPLDLGSDWRDKFDAPEQISGRAKHPICEFPGPRGSRFL